MKLSTLQTVQYAFNTKIENSLYRCRTIWPRHVALGQRNSAHTFPQHLERAILLSIDIDVHIAYHIALAGVLDRGGFRTQTITVYLRNIATSKY